MRKTHEGKSANDDAFAFNVSDQGQDAFEDRGLRHVVDDVFNPRVHPWSGPPRRRYGSLAHARLARLGWWLLGVFQRRKGEAPQAFCSAESLKGATCRRAKMFTALKFAHWRTFNPRLAPRIQSAVVETKAALQVGFYHLWLLLNEVRSHFPQPPLHPPAISAR